MIYYKIVYVNKCLDCKKRFRATIPGKDLCQKCDIRLEEWIAEQERRERNKSLTSV